jgi:hypothetical protein
MVGDGRLKGFGYVVATIMERDTEFLGATPNPKPFIFLIT